MINSACKLYDKLKYIYTTQYDNLSEGKKKKTNVLNRPENLTFDFDEDNLPTIPSLEVGKEVKLEPEENIAGRVKSNPPKRKKQKQD